MFGDRVLVAAYRCGNGFTGVETEVEKLNVFTNVLHPRNRTLVPRHRKAAGNYFTFREMISFANDEGEAFRSCHPAAKTLPKGRLTRTAHAVHFVDED